VDAFGDSLFGVPSLQTGRCRGPGSVDRSQLDLSLEATPDHDQDQARRHANDHDNETSVGQEKKILFLDMISIATRARDCRNR
jgi:hypothetical protein